MPTRSNSSHAYRKILKENYVIIPDLSVKVHMRKYFDLARMLYYQAVGYLKVNNLPNAYIDFFKFQLLVLVKLPTHPDYNKFITSDYKTWLEKAKESALSSLENIAGALDAIEDAKLKEEQDNFLLSAFDAEDRPSRSSPESTASRIFGTSTAGPTRNGSSSDAAGDEIKNRLDLLRLGKPTVKGNTVSSNSNSSSGSTTTANFATTKLPRGDMVYTASLVDSSLIPADIAAGTNSSSSSRTDLNATVTSTTDADEDESSLYYMPEILDLTMQPSSFSKIPPPTVYSTELFINNKSYIFIQDDFHVSFLPFMPYLTLELQMDKCAIETNRCFFLHLGVAVGVHPYLLQTAFRFFAATEKKDPDCWYADILDSLLNYTGLVDANILSIWWPAEFERFRICLISGPASNPIFSSFSCDSAPADCALEDILIRCCDNHFTLWKPAYSSGTGATLSTDGKRFEILQQLFYDARAAGMIVQHITARSIPADDQDKNKRKFHSIRTAINALLQEKNHCGLMYHFTGH